ncbi:Plasma-membrane choline transporter-like protein 1 [Elsinoe fawcettii]|nr:Plasma-membrane choline transporter-like protein 1 [Elsinoe fawcettii]
MFSEYASRFLAQSQSRLSLTPQENTERSRNPLDRRRAPSASRYVQRSNLVNPYQQQSGSYMSRFPFTSRRTQEQSAPLFSSQHFDPEADDEEQHERDMADFLALRESRRNFGPSHLTESSEMDEERRDNADDAPTESIDLRDRAPKESRIRLGESTRQAGRGKSRLVDVNLDSTIRESAEYFDAAASEMDDRPSTYAYLSKTPGRVAGRPSLMPRETDEEAQRMRPSPPSPDQEDVPHTVILPAPRPPHHDVFWAHLYKISLFAMFATFVLVWFHTSTPTSKRPLGDTIYSALTGSLNLLLWDTVITVVVAMIWLALLREYVRALVFLMLIAVPVILFSFSLYPFISSFKGSWGGDSVQDRAMRWLSFIPAITGCVWVYSVYKGRHSLGKAISILEFACRIVTASPALILLGFATLTVVVCFTWVWLGMFTRVFLSGHFSKLKTFILDISSWWLGFYFILIYLWSLGVIAGIQRSTTAATVSQWYFHRLSSPSPSSNEVVLASLQHASGPMLGSICLSTFLSLLIRLPLIILPRRLASIVTLFFYSLVPTSLAALTNPLTLTYAAIHSQPLSISARGLSQLHFVSRTTPSTTLSPGAFRAESGSAMIPYRLAKLLLHATRFVMSFALGFAGWVSTAHSLSMAGQKGGSGGGAGIKGSLYGYLVGLIAASIGWAVLGAIEGVIGGVVDAAVVCWASETGGRGGGGEARYCREAGELFGEGDI